MALLDLTMVIPDGGGEHVIRPSIVDVPGVLSIVNIVLHDKPEIRDPLIRAMAEADFGEVKRLAHKIGEAVNREANLHVVMALLLMARACLNNMVSQMEAEDGASRKLLGAALQQSRDTEQSH